jgi:hypothetical protein
LLTHPTLDLLHQLGLNGMAKALLQKNLHTGWDWAGGCLPFLILPAARARARPRE